MLKRLIGDKNFFLKTSIYEENYEVYPQLIQFSL